MKKFLLIFLSFSLSICSAADINIVFSGNNRGLLTPCGCAVPSGGWARIGTVLNKTDKQTIRVAAGNHFFHHTPMPNDDQIFEQKKAVFQAELFKENAFDAINIGQFDLCYGLRFLQSLETNMELPFISANIRDLNGNPAFPPYKIITRHDVDIAFIGICTLPSGFNYIVSDPLQALSALLEDGIDEEADFVVLLADAPSKSISDFVKATPGIDFIVCAKDHSITGIPIHYAATALTQLGSQGKYLGKLSLHYAVQNEKWNDLSVYKEYVRSAEKQLLSTNKKDKKRQWQYKRHEKIQKQILHKKMIHSPNYYFWEMTLLDSKIKDLPEIKERVLVFEDYPE